LTNKRDEWHEAVRKVSKTLGEFRIVTTDEVLTEFLTSLSGGEFWRKKTAGLVRAILEDTNVTVIRQTHASFLMGLGLYEKRPDKDYSLTDCISMETMKAQGLTEILTNDHHFEQEGFTVLIKKEDVPSES
jgi:predicted nucleic acid-binding protein